MKRQSTLLWLLLLSSAAFVVAGCDDVPEDPAGLFLTGLVPEAAPPGELVLVRGGGFGTDPALVRVTVAGLDVPVDEDVHSESATAFVVPDSLPPGTWPLVLAVEDVVSNGLLFEVQVAQ